MYTVFSVILFLALTCLLTGLINPDSFRRVFKSKTSRSLITLVFSLISVFSLFIILLTTPPQQISKPVVSSNKAAITTKNVTTNTIIPYTTSTIRDTSLPAGSISIRVKGVDGSETQTWLITYTNGVQTDKKLVSTVINTQPINEVIYVGATVTRNPRESTDN